MKRRLLLRVAPYNRFTWPLLLNILEINGLDDAFDIRFVDGPVAMIIDDHLADARRDDIMLFSFMTPHLAHVAGDIAAVRGRVITAAGGIHTSAWPDHTRSLGFDIVFTGPAERSFAEFARDITEQNTYRDRYDGSDNDPFDDAIPLTRHIRFFPPLEIIRGCRWHCRYCATGRHPRYRSFASVERYLEKLREIVPHRVGFIAPSALDYGIHENDPDALARVLSHARSRFRFVEFGVFPSELRPESVTHESLSMIKRYATNRRLVIGCQSASNKRLSAIARGHTADDVIRAAATANECGFRALFDIIVAYPDETPDERSENILFIRDVTKRYNARFHLHHFFPLAGSDYEFRFPSFMSDAERNAFLSLAQNGTATPWWHEDEKNARAYFSYIVKNYPDLYARYH
ncbi:MAG: TIGR04013 family B12-binding domain/radical SAM domain-containing protein [Spirochaetes bacterium]|nr:TIGR04013 family B12-binding domain/radical SAM domain-containing protein [Spirochaetota bacterium]